MRRLGAGLALLTVAATALVWAAPAASAKGAQDAVLRGPDVEKEGVAKLDQHQTMTLALATSFYNAIWNQDSRTSRVVPREPTGDLGPRYVVTYNLMVGQDETVPIRQRLYPFAARGPVAFTPPGQPLETKIQKIGATGRSRPCKDCRRSTGGWFDMRFGALDVLADVGVPIPAALDRSTWPRTRDERQGISIAYPASWHAAASTLVPVQLDPIIPLAIGTSALEPQHADECGIIPTRALAAVGPTDAFVAVYLTQGMASWSASTDRPTQFGPDSAWRSGVTKCSDGMNPPMRSMSFEDRGKKLTLMVAIGKDASPQRTAEAYAVLDSLHVD